MDRDDLPAATVVFSGPEAIDENVLNELANYGLAKSDIQLINHLIHEMRVRDSKLKVLEQQMRHGEQINRKLQSHLKKSEHNVVSAGCNLCEEQVNSLYVVDENKFLKSKLTMLKRRLLNKFKSVANLESCAEEQSVVTRAASHENISGLASFVTRRLSIPTFETNKNLFQTD